MYINVYAFLNMYVYVCTSQTLISSVFRIDFLSHILRHQGISLDTVLSDSARLVVQPAPGILGLSLTLYNKSFKHCGVEETAQQLRTLIALAEDPSLISSTYIW